MCEKEMYFLWLEVLEAFIDVFIFLLPACFVELFYHSFLQIFLSLFMLLIFNYNNYTLWLLNPYKFKALESLPNSLEEKSFQLGCENEKYSTLNSVT